MRRSQTKSSVPKVGRVRLTLPQQRSEQTRRGILDAASWVFRRRGYGEATVDDILARAGVSRGAFYHHYAGKEQVFRDLLDEHVRGDLVELQSVGPAGSFREFTERCVAFWLEHVRPERDIGPLFIEFWAQATRAAWAREAVTDLFKLGRTMTAGMLRICQDAGLARPDLDVEAAASFIHAAFAGIALLQAIDPTGLDAERFRRPWADFIARVIETDEGRSGGGDVAVLQSSLASFLEMVETQRGSRKSGEHGEGGRAAQQRTTRRSRSGGPKEARGDGR